MSVFERVAAQARARVPLTRLPVPPLDGLRPTWQDARLGRIARALADAGTRDPSGWYVAGPSTAVPRGRSLARTIAGRASSRAWLMRSRSVSWPDAAASSTTAATNPCDERGGTFMPLP